MFYQPMQLLNPRPCLPAVACPRHQMLLFYLASRYGGQDSAIGVRHCFVAVADISGANVFLYYCLLFLLVPSFFLRFLFFPLLCLFHLFFTWMFLLFIYCTRWRDWLRHCDKSRKVAGSIPDGDIILPTALWCWGRHIWPVPGANNLPNFVYRQLTVSFTLEPSEPLGVLYKNCFTFTFTYISVCFLSLHFLPFQFCPLHILISSVSLSCFFYLLIHLYLEVVSSLVSSFLPFLHLSFLLLSQHSPIVYLSLYLYRLSS